MNPEQYFETVVTPLLKHPEALEIESKTDLRGLLLTVTSHKEDIGVIIGKGGKTAEALRLLIRIFGLANHNATVSLKVNEPNNDR